jgi:hypothetical protein
VTIEIETGLVTGKMSKRALRMLFEWLESHQEELLNNWERAQVRQPLNKISPLE